MSFAQWWHGDGGVDGREYGLARFPCGKRSCEDDKARNSPLQGIPYRRYKTHITRNNGTAG